MASGKMYGELQVKDLPREKRQARVCIIYTGGTIGMVPKDPENPASALKPASLEELFNAVHGLGEKEGIELGMVSFHDPVDSSDISSGHWLAMAEAIEEHYDDFNGFVVLHGTDTMAYTTSALSFLLNNLDKPVVVTGSQLPITDPRTDGVMNLTSAVHIAGYKAADLPKISEVVLCFMNVLLRGNRATKVSSTQWQGFASPNFPPLGTLGEYITINKDLRLKLEVGEEKPQFYADKSLASEIKIILVNPGLTPEQLERDLRTEGLEGVILLTYGAGNMPTSPEFIEVIRTAVEGGVEYSTPIVVMNVTQCVEGKVEMGLYEASSGLLEAGVTSGLDMTLEAAVAKIYWVIRKFRGRDIHTQLQIAHRGEQSENLSDLVFDPGTAKKQSKAVERIQPEAQQIPGEFDRRKLTRAMVRVQGLGIEPSEDDAPASIHIFLNDIEANRDTPIRSPSFAGEILSDTIPESGNVVRDVTETAKTVVHGREPLSATLVGMNCKLWCRSIHVGLFTDAQ